MSKETERLDEHISNNAMMISELAKLLVQSLPHLGHQVDYLFSEWNRVAKEINEEYGVTEEETKP